MVGTGQHILTEKQTRCIFHIIEIYQTTLKKNKKGEQGVTISPAKNKMKDKYYEKFLEHAYQMISGLRSGTKARREESIIYYCAAYFYKQGNTGNYCYEYVRKKFIEFENWIKTNDPKNYIYITSKLIELINKEV